VTFGVRESGDLAGGADGIPCSPLRDAVEAADVVVFAIPGAAMSTVIGALGGSLNGRLVIDAANVVGEGAMNSRQTFLTHAPEARYVRAFNSLGHEVLADPIVGGVRADGFWSGPDDARPATEALIEDAGLRPVRVGDSEDADTVDGLLRAWFLLAVRQHRGRRLAFKVVEDAG
jgi:predicted dinucleotide-binding enzyme